MQSKKTEEMFQDMVNTICEDLPMQESCKNALNSLFQSVKARIHDINPKALCKALHLCKDKETCTYSQRKQNSLKLQSPSTCEMCKDGVKVIVDALKSEQVQQMLNNAMKEACRAIPHEALRGKCEELFSGPFLRWIGTIIQKVDGDKVCDSFGLCDKLYKSPDDIQTCQLCKDILGEFKSLAGNVKFVNSVKDAVDFGCTFTFGFTEQCRSLAKNFIDVAIEEVKKLDAEKICHDVRVC